MLAGGTLREHLLQLQRSEGVTPSELITPPPPPALRYLADWFSELVSGRQYGDMGAPQPLAWADIAAWAQLNELLPKAWEVRVLRHLDALWRAAWAEGRPKPKNKTRVSD